MRSIFVRWLKGNVGNSDYHSASTHGYVTRIETADWRHTRITFEDGRIAMLKGGELDIRPGHIISVYGYLGEDGVFYAQHHFNSWNSSMSGFAYNATKAWNAMAFGTIFGHAVARQTDAPPFFVVAVGAAIAFSIKDFLNQRRTFRRVRERLLREVGKA